MWHMVGSLVSEAILESLFCATGSNHCGFQDFCSPQLDAKSLGFVQPIIQEFVNIASFFLSFHTGSSFSVAFCSHSYHFSAWQLCCLWNPRNSELEKQFAWYGGWKKSCIHQLRSVVYPRIYKVWYILGGAGFLPSTVVMRETLTISINPKKIRSGTTSSTC